MRRDYDQESREAIERIATAGPAIAKGLGAGWTFEHYSDDGRLSERSFYLCHIDGTILSGWQDRGRFRFTGQYVGGSHRDDPAMGVDASRPGAVIAREIKRRILADVRRIAKERFSYRAQQEQKTARYTDTMYSIATTIGAQIYRAHNDHLLAEIGGYADANKFTLDGSPYERAGCFDLTLTISRATPELATQIGLLVSAYHKQQKETRNV